MGNIFSGRRSSRLVTEDCLRLDASTLTARDCFEKGCLRREQLKWIFNGQKVASAEVDVILFPKERPRAVLKMHGLAPQTIWLTYTRPHYGGRRWWFICPSGRRCRTLYLQPSGGYFISAKAANLAYHSQQLGSGDRVRWRATKLRRLLPGAKFDFNPPKPKGMHRTTYDRIVGRLRESDAAVDELWKSAVVKWARDRGFTEGD